MLQSRCLHEMASQNSKEEIALHLRKEEGGSLDQMGSIETGQLESSILTLE